MGIEQNPHSTSFKSIQHRIRQRLIEVLRNHSLTRQQAEPATRGYGVERHKFGDRLASLGDDDLRASRRFVQETRKVSLGSVNIHD